MRAMGVIFSSTINTYARTVYGLIYLDYLIKQHIPPKLLTEDKQLQTRAADSAITKHLISSWKCRTSEDGLKERFTVLALAHNKSHLDMLEGLFIKHLTPELCAQKEHVRVLQLF